MSTQTIKKMRLVTQALAASRSTEECFKTLITGLSTALNLQHLIILVPDEKSRHLYTVASHGYENSGVGSEVAMGKGVIGMVAKTQRPLLIGAMAHHMASAETFTGKRKGPLLQIPFPGLKQPQSQAAIPVTGGKELLAVIFSESSKSSLLNAEEFELLGIIADQMASAMLASRALSGAVLDAQASAAKKAKIRSGKACELVFYKESEAIFADGEYLIKNIPARILWKLLKAYRKGQDEFLNKKLRMDKGLGLPEIKDNLECRLILLRKRLEEACPKIKIQGSGRGRFKLNVSCTIKLSEKSE